MNVEVNAKELMLLTQAFVATLNKVPKMFLSQAQKEKIAEAIALAGKLGMQAELAVGDADTVQQIKATIASYLK